MNVTVELSKFDKDLLIDRTLFPLSVSTPVKDAKKSVADAFMDAKDPENVVFASRAVVPEIPKLFCITEIALTTLPKLMLDSSTVIPNSS